MHEPWCAIGLPLIAKCSTFVRECIYVFKILRQTTVEQSELEILQNNYINEGEKSQTSFEAFLSACNHYFYSKKQTNKKI